MQTVTELGRRLGVAATCAALGVVRASYYRSRKPRPEPCPRPTPTIDHSGLNGSPATKGS